MQNLIVVALGAVILLPHVDAFISPRSAPHSSVKGLGFEQRVAVTPIMSYADKLKEARAAKEAAARARSNPSSAMPSMASVPAVAIAESGSGAMGMNSKPLSDEILEAIRTAITILTARLQREKPLTRSEFERFESAVAVVVEDALPRQELPTQTMPSSPPPRATLMPPQVEPEGTTVDEVQNEGPEWDPKGGYGLPRGVRNSYVIDDMGKMTPEEYQAALRRKVIARAQSARKKGSYGNISAKDYIAFLGKNPKTGDAAYERHKKTVEKRPEEDFGKY